MERCPYREVIESMSVIVSCEWVGGWMGDEWMGGRVDRRTDR